jgi:hypothetical protein
MLVSSYNPFVRVNIPSIASDQRELNRLHIKAL